MRNKGVHIWESRPGFLTLAHAESDLDRIATAFIETLKEMQASTFLTILDDAPPLSGARMALDSAGRPAWFVPDPDRRGKYLQVQLTGN